MKSNERLIQYFDITIHGKTRAHDIPNDIGTPKSLDDLMKDFVKLHDKKLSRKRVSARSNLEFRLEDIEEREHSWVVLLNVVDADAAHPVTQLMGGGEADRKVVELGNERGLESSTHIVISKTPDKVGKHLVLYEKTPNLPYSKAASFLNFMSKLAAREFNESYKKAHPSGQKNKTINTYCSLQLLGHPSREFFDELDDGVISDMRLTTDAVFAHGYDANLQPELIGTEIKMKVSKVDVMFAGGNISYLNKAIKYADDLDIPYVRIQFKDQSGTGHTAILSSDTMQMANADKYIKKRKIEGFGNSLKTAFPAIHEGIRDRMLGLLE